MVADAFNFYHHSIAVERRDPYHCAFRYELCFGEYQAVDGDISMESFDIPEMMHPGHTRSASVNSTVPRKYKSMDEFVPTATGDDDPKFMRHKFVHRAIKRVMKRREEEIKARGKYRFTRGNQR
jgi:hypothetical protein